MQKEQSDSSSSKQNLQELNNRKRFEEAYGPNVTSLFTSIAAALTLMRRSR